MQDGAVLAYQNAKLSETLEAQRAEIRGLEQQLAKLQQRLQRHDNTAGVLKRAWQGLDADLHSLLLTLDPAHPAADPSSSAASEPSAAERPRGTSAAELFVRHLVLQPLSDDVADDMLEEALRARRGTTQRILAQLVTAIQEERRRGDALLERLRHEPGAVASEVLDRLQRDALSAKSVADHAQAREAAAIAECTRLRDQHAKDEARIDNLLGELDTKSMELQAARRKIEMYKQGHQLMAVPVPLLGGANNSPRAPAADSVAAGSNAAKGNDEQLSVDHVRFKELEQQLAEAQNLAARRLVERDEACEEVMKSAAQCRQLQEAVDLESRAHLAVQRQLQQVMTELDGLRATVETCTRERDAAQLAQKDAVLRAEHAESFRRALTLCEERLADAERRLGAALSERDELALRLEHAALEHAAETKADTVRELKAMVGTLQREVGMLQRELSRAKQLAAMLDPAREHARRASHAHDLLVEETTALTSSYEQKAAELAAVQKEVLNLRRTQKELRLFVEAFQMASSESREEIEARVAMRKLADERDELKSQLANGHVSKETEEAHQAQKESEAAVQRYAREVAQLKIELQHAQWAVDDVRQSLQAKTEEADAYVSEIEVIGNAYEDMQSQNARLLQQLTERDDYNTQLMAERIKARQVQTAMAEGQEEVVRRLQHAESTVEVLKQRCVRLEEQLQSTLEALAKTTDEARRQAAIAESLKKAVQDNAVAATEAKFSLEDERKRAAEKAKRAQEDATELDRERLKRKRAEDERDAFAAKVERVSQSGATSNGTVTQELQEEVNAYKKLLKCSVCLDRPKEVVLTKCFHVFCSPCIQRNLELRHRKCPGCGVPFGQQDVHSIYL
eukprot:jgi/Chlat1/6882/Chrsp51S06552